MKNIFLLFFLCNIAFYSCSETETLIPIVTTTPITSKTQTTAMSGGNVTDNGGSKVTVRGVCWNTNSNPTISDNNTNDGIGTGSFTSSIFGLVENTTYYYRAYATNGNGTTYGEELSFYTGIGILDQQQPIHNYGFFVHEEERWQSFIPSLKNISAIELYIHTSNPTGNCTVSIQSENGAITYAKQYFGTSSLPEFGWIGMEIIPPIPTTPNTKYRISIIRSVTHTPENAIYWSGDTEANYPGYCDPDPDHFNSHWDNYDYTFKTYGF